LKITGPHIVVIFLVLLSGCANKVMPGGGPKDTDPPKVIQTTPVQNQTLFSGTEINVVFDEYIQLKDVSKQLVVSPPVFPKPVVQSSGKSVKISFEKLMDSTTYVISFGKSIVDVNEGNSLDNYRFVFSTGPELDTLYMSGKAYDLHTGKPLQNGVAMLFKFNDTDAIMDTVVPDHFAKCDENGNFKIENASAGNYRLAVLSEKNENLILDEAGEKAGFVDEVIQLPVSRTFEVWASEQAPSKPQIVSTNLVPPATMVTVFNVDAKSALVKGINVDLIGTRTVLSKDGDTVYVFMKQKPVQLPVEAVWSINELEFDTSVYRSRSPKESSGDKLSLMFDSGLWDNPEAPARIQLSAPLQTLAESKIRLVLDSVAMEQPSISIAKDSMSVEIKRPAMAGSYLVRLDSGAFKDIYGRVSDSTAFQMSIPEGKSRGSVSYFFQGKPKPGAVLQLLNESGQVVRNASCEDGSEGSFTMLSPGKYRLRILEDKNGNGRWDKGNIRQGIQPEWFIYHTNEITVRGNWEVEAIFNIR
jgi:hypothetical protein